MTEYQTVEGTDPSPLVTHSPRTMTRTNEDSTMYMMTEIGDGVFVQWGECSKCNLRVDGCTCKDGPSEPHYMAKWRNERFERSFKARPEPTHDVLPQVVSELKRIGYTVTHKDDAKAEVLPDKVVSGGMPKPEPEPESEPLPETPSGPLPPARDEVAGRSDVDVTGLVDQHGEEITDVGQPPASDEPEASDDRNAREHEEQSRAKYDTSNIDIDF